LFVSRRSPVTVGEYNGTTGAFVRHFATAAGNGLLDPRGLVFGPNGNLFVTSGGCSPVLEFNGTTGAFERDFAPCPNLGRTIAPYGLLFGPNGNLFVAGATSNNVAEYNGTTGAFERVFVSSGSGGLSDPRFLLELSVPEPATLSLMVLGLLGAGFAGRKRRN
jgi:streptogramin lyase